MNTALTAFSETGLILAYACLTCMPGPEIPSDTGFWYFIESFAIFLAVECAIISSCFVWPLITAPNVTTASISLLCNNLSIINGHWSSPLPA